jgi:hypothetical protein
MRREPVPARNEPVTVAALDNLDRGQILPGGELFGKRRNPRRIDRPQPAGGVDFCDLYRCQHVYLPCADASSSSTCVMID